jgi:hypothetical protein
MKKLQFNIDINAPREKVWEALWKLDNYRNWASVFSENSSAEIETDWKQGTKVIFGDGSGNGMYSLIAENRKPEYMAFKHLGEIKDGVEQPESSWAGSMETYSLDDRGGVTSLTVELDTVAEFEEFFSETFPKALEKVKGIAEG